MAPIGGVRFLYPTSWRLVCSDSLHQTRSWEVQRGLRVTKKVASFDRSAHRQP